MLHLTSCPTGKFTVVCELKMSVSDEMETLKGSGHGIFHGGKGKVKVSPLQALLWPRGWVEV